MAQGIKMILLQVMLMVINGQLGGGFGRKIIVPNKNRAIHNELAEITNTRVEINGGAGVPPDPRNGKEDGIGWRCLAADQCRIYQVHPRECWHALTEVDTSRPKVQAAIRPEPVPEPQENHRHL